MSVEPSDKASSKVLNPNNSSNNLTNIQNTYYDKDDN